MVSHVEVIEEHTETGEPRRVIRVLEISQRQPSAIGLTGNRVAGPNGFDRLPDELLERILNYVGMANGTSVTNLMDPFEAGWKDEEEIIQDALRFGSSMGILRRVCWRFFDLATPLFLRRLVISEAQWGKDPLWGLIGRLGKFLSVRRSSSDSEGKRRVGQLQRTGPGSPIPYGHHVRQLIISNRTIPPGVTCWLLETIHPLLPNLISLGGLNLSQISRLLSPAIRFPRLMSLTGIDLAAAPNRWTAGYDEFPALDSATPPVHIQAAPAEIQAAPPSQVISQEIFLGILNHHPQVAYLSCRGLQIDESGANRLIALLRANQLSIPLFPSSGPRADNFFGLKMLHIGLNSVVDLQLLRLLPSVAPHLHQLHIEAGCKVDDKLSEQSAQTWSISQLLRALPQITHLTFIGQHNLPSRRGSRSWASSNKVLRVAPHIQSLNLRMDSFTTVDFFDSLMMEEGGRQSLRKLNVWHRPTLNVNPNTESWSIISFDGPQTLGRLDRAVRIMRKEGLEWPSVESQQRDLWLKLKDLSRLDLIAENSDDNY